MWVLRVMTFNLSKFRSICAIIFIFLLPIALDFFKSVFCFQNFSLNTDTGTRTDQDKEVETEDTFDDDKASLPPQHSYFLEYVQSPRKKFVCGGDKFVPALA